MASPTNRDASDWPANAMSNLQLAPRTTRPRSMSDGSQTWKSKGFSDLMEGFVPETPTVKRWDGIERTCTIWNNLERDPELWYRTGNCFVHLYGKGQSHRGPAFKVSYDGLLTAKCHPLIARFITHDALNPAAAYIEQGQLDLLGKNDSNGKIDLYIPPPLMATKLEIKRFHLGVRNFFAWVFGKPVVGDYLGTALIRLLLTMAEFRCPSADNIDALMGYLNGQGYLEMGNQPIHALAMLHVAENFQFRELYVDSFAHCVGMSDKLFTAPEYQAGIITSVTRKLIRQVRAEMDVKLAHAGVMLRNFLEDDLSEAHIGLTESGRAHLEHFRTFLFAFFSSRLGYYPPVSIDNRSLIFERNTYHLMREDVEALYEYLVDRSFTVSKNMPVLAQGGICTLQSVHGFDLRNKYTPLPHPLPLLPEIAPSSHSRRMSISWLNKPDKLKPDQRLIAHAALVQATNSQEPDLLMNPLVLAYRKFEEESLFSPFKTDRHEKLSQVDARKIRWILVYSIYQVLRSCTDDPPECQDTDGIRYNITINMSYLPPWREGRRQVSIRSRDSPHRNHSFSSPNPILPVPITPALTPESEHASSASAIQPDVDYFSLTRQKNTPAPGRRSRLGSPPVIPPRVRRLNTTLRRSLCLSIPSPSSGMTPNTTSSNTPSSSSTAIGSAPDTGQRMPPYQEIIVQGYGNGTNSVRSGIVELLSVATPTATDTNSTTVGNRLQEPCEDLKPQPLAVRSKSTASTSSTNSIASSTISRFSNLSTVSTVSTAPTATSPVEWIIPPPWETKDADPSANTGDNITIPEIIPVIPLRRRSAPKHNIMGGLKLDEASPPPALPRKNSRRKLNELMQPNPLNIYKGPELTSYDAGGCQPVDVSSIDHTSSDGEGPIDDTVSEVDSFTVPGRGEGKIGDVLDQFSDVGGMRDMSTP
ncbi:hypothetical protein B0H63DRAFT_529015 [Podospora didyma]|uniref:DUF8004 domain-containing protein n=1 Tax=Podospora didyma TaxID=330526 RepID=A0AAE0N3D1_9PEZI|nr:hypothetical protein B0H63DRAFT_529015 [Podospora didyma]